MFIRTSFNPNMQISADVPITTKVSHQQLTEYHTRGKLSPCSPSYTRFDSETFPLIIILSPNAETALPRIIAQLSSTIHRQPSPLGVVTSSGQNIYVTNFTQLLLVLLLLQLSKIYSHGFNHCHVLKMLPNLWPLCIYSVW